MCSLQDLVDLEWFTKGIRFPLIFVYRVELENSSKVPIEGSELDELNEPLDESFICHEPSRLVYE